MASLGTLTLDLVAKTGSFTGPLDKAERASKKNATAISKHQREITGAIGSSLKSLAGWAAGFVAFSSIKSFVKNSLDAAGAIQDVAATAGVTTDTLQEMRHVTSLFGMDAEQADAGLQKFNKSIGELKAGTGLLYTYLSKTDKALLSQVQSAKSADAALDIIFKSMKDVADSSERSALAVAAFGRSGQRMAIMADDYERLRKEAQDLGLVIDSELIESADEAGDKLDTMSRIIKTQLTSAVLELAPAIQTAAMAMVDLSKDWAWILGGQKRSNERVAELQATTAEMQGLNALLREQRDIQTRLTMLKEKGSWYDPEELRQAQSNIESLLESIRELNGAGSGAPTTPDNSELSQQQTVEIYKKAFSELETITQKTYDVMKGEYQKDRDEFIDLTGDKLTAQAIYNKNIEALNEKLTGKDGGDSWGDFGDVLKATSERNKQRLEMIKKSNEAISKERERQLQEDIAMDNRYQQLVEQADIAELNNITNNIERELALHEYKYKRMVELGTYSKDELVQIERLKAAELEDIMSEQHGEGYWENFVASMENNMMNMDSIVGDSISSWTSQFGNFFASAILDSENLGDAFKTMAMGMANTVVSAIGQMIAQWLVYKAVKIATDKSTQAAAIPAIVTNAEVAALQAGINAYASAAAVPIVGWAMAPGAMAAALAVTQPMAASIAGLSVAGMAHDGINSVPETGTWLLKKGERVTTAETSQRLDDVLNRIQDGINGATEAKQQMSIRGTKEAHYHYHSEGPTFLNRAQMKDAARMLLSEMEREKTRIGAI